MLVEVLKKELHERIKNESNDSIKEMLININELLNNENIPNMIKTRIKNVYGLYKKLNKGGIYGKLYKENRN